MSVHVHSLEFKYTLACKLYVTHLKCPWKHKGSQVYTIYLEILGDEANMNYVLNYEKRAARVGVTGHDWLDSEFSACTQINKNNLTTYTAHFVKMMIKYDISIILIIVSKNIEENMYICLYSTNPIWHNR